MYVRACICMYVCTCMHVRTYVCVLWTCVYVRTYVYYDMPYLGVYTRQKERRLKILKSRRTSSSGHTDEAAAQKVLKVIMRLHTYISRP